MGHTKQADANEDLRGLLNAGHQRNRPMLRWDVTSRTAEQLDTFAMALLAAIGELPDTIMDRAVIIRMRRRAPGEQVDPYRTRRDAPPLHDLRESLSGWARQHLHELQHAQPAMPLEDRAADTWEPLIAIADLAGGEWPARARDAAATMTAAEAQQEEDTSASVRLLADLRQVFHTTGAEGLYTSTILEALHQLEDAPWADWYGRPLTTRDLAKLLRPYQVESKNIREHGTGAPRKGYTRADLQDAWARYVPLHPLHELQASEPAGHTGNGHVADQQRLSATSATGPGDVADVAADPEPVRYRSDLRCSPCSGCSGTPRQQRQRLALRPAHDPVRGLRHRHHQPRPLGPATTPRLRHQDHEKAPTMAEIHGRLRPLLACHVIQRQGPQSHPGMLTPAPARLRAAWGPLTADARPIAIRPSRHVHGHNPTTGSARSR